MNKEIERFYLQQFLESIQIDVTQIIDYERPDFLITSKAQTYGVEITNLKQKNNSSIAGDNRKIVRNACNIAIKNTLEPIDIHVWFYDSKANNVQKYIKDASDYLYSLILDSISIIKKANGHSVEIPCTDNHFSFCQITAHWHSIDGNRWLDHHRWETEEPGFVSKNFANFLQAEISKKNRKITEYRKASPICWLIIVVDRSKMDEHFDYSYMDQTISYQSNFEKTYFFDLCERKIYDLITNVNGEVTKI